ncbi:MAG: ABC transporter ATP-binding protein/permease [Erysipelotrichaceae bacterium]|jgi:ATP-binding cassette subfamily B protein|nr:ABC transporter ATP-binding protein/permease [Erysipelotrichaceae bacterium]
MATFSFKEEKIPDKLNFAVWAKMFKYVKAHWILLIILATTMIITSFYDASFTPLMNASLINAVSTHSSSDISSLLIKVNLIFGINFEVNFLWYALLFVFGILFRAFAIFFTFYITNLLEMYVMTSLRRDSFRRVQELSFSYYDRTPSGWLIARMQNDTSDIGEMISWGVIRIFWTIADVSFAVISMFSYSWELSLVILATTPILIILVPIIEKRILKLSRTARGAYSNFVRWLAECINGAKTIKTLAIEESTYNEAKEVGEDIRKKRYKAGLPTAILVPVVSIVSALTSGLIVIFGTYVFNLRVDATSIALFTTFIAFVSSIYNPIQDFSETFSEFMSTQASVEKVLQLINAKPEIVDTPEVIEKYGGLFDNKKHNFERIEGEINYKDISFSYANGVEVIHNLNLKIAKGEKVAIVGETGSGKTTIVNLLCRFYEPTSGEVIIDGVNYKNRSVGWLRSNIGYVQQNPFIFNGTYKDNIRYGKLDASDEEIESAAKAVGIDEFISSQSKGYDTVLEDGGNQLSVGQKQLISFARAIIRNPAIMILDEATSSIDTETEAMIQSAVNKSLMGRTSIIIAHRLSTIVDADRIIVMNDGKIVEEGTHTELILKKGWYHHLYMNQFKELNIDSQIEQYKNQIENKNIKI